MTKVKTVTLQEDVVVKDTPFEERLWNFLADCGKVGAMFQEMYEEFPEVTERHIRTKIRDFINRELIDITHSCRCGRGTIYIAKSFKKYDSIANLNNRTVYNKVKDMKQYKKKGF